jgi:superfamily I DNA and/or RNA helicase
MHPAISEFPSNQFYNGKITDGITSQDRPFPRGFPWPNPSKPISFISVNGLEEPSADGNSKQNVEEANLVVKLVDNFMRSGFSAKDIGVISPYNGQVSLLKSIFLAKGGPSEDSVYHKLTVHSVDGFQGEKKNSS